MQQLRTKMMADQEMVASKRRFGLFSQPPPLAVGDNSFAHTTKMVRGQDGKPKTQPRNMLAGPPLSGIRKKDYIQVPSSIYQNDPYNDNFKIEIKYQNAMHRKGEMHQCDFKLTKASKTITNSAYPYAEQKQNPQKKARKNAQGRVYTEPANITSNPMTKVDRRLFKIGAHQPDPFDRPKQIAKQQLNVWKSKIIHQNMFKSMSHGNKAFTKDKIQYGLDDKTKSIIAQKRSHQLVNNSMINHDTKFKLARRGHGDAIGRYPEWDGSRKRVQTEASRTSTTKTGERQSWKPNRGHLSRPTPSVSLMAKNMRKKM